MLIMRLPVLERSYIAENAPDERVRTTTEDRVTDSFTLHMAH